MPILFQSEDVLKFACIDFSSQHQKRRKALCIQTDLFLSCPKSKGSCPNTGIVWARGASKHGMYAGEVPKNYVTHDKSLVSKLLSCDVQKNCPGEDLDPGPTGEGCPSCCCSLSFFMGSLSFTISLHGFQNM